MGVELLLLVLAGVYPAQMLKTVIQAAVAGTEDAVVALPLGMAPSMGRCRNQSLTARLEASAKLACTAAAGSSTAKLVGLEVGACASWFPTH
jgi:hypothetical protein